MATPPRALVLGASGLIGRGLPAWLKAIGWECSGVSRQPRPDIPGFSAWQSPATLDCRHHDAVINLAGEPVACRWTPANRQRLHASRIDVTQQLVAQIATLPASQRPRVLVNGSAVGIYGDCGEDCLTESSNPGHGFLADLCVAWERAANEATQYGLRVVCMRSGMVMARDAPAMRKLCRVIKTGLGGPLGSGRQWMPWIHIDDLRRAIIHSLVDSSLQGPVNGVAPGVERNRSFTRQLARHLHRPAIFPVPAPILKLVLDGFGGALLESQHIRPAALEAHGFQFRFPTLEGALTDLIPTP